MQIRSNLVLSLYNHSTDYLEFLSIDFTFTGLIIDYLIFQANYLSFGLLAQNRESEAKSRWHISDPTMLGHWITLLIFVNLDFTFSDHPGCSGTSGRKSWFQREHFLKYCSIHYSVETCPFKECTENRWHHLVMFGPPFKSVTDCNLYCLPKLMYYNSHDLVVMILDSVIEPSRYQMYIKDFTAYCCYRSKVIEYSRLKYLLKLCLIFDLMCASKYYALEPSELWSSCDGLDTVAHDLASILGQMTDFDHSLWAFCFHSAQYDDLRLDLSTTLHYHHFTHRLKSRRTSPKLTGGSYGIALRAHLTWVRWIDCFLGQRFAHSPRIEQS